MGRQDIQLLTLFPRLQVRGRLREAAQTCRVTAALLHRERRTLEVTVLPDAQLTGATLRGLERALGNAYALSAVLLQAGKEEPAGGDKAQGQNAALDNAGRGSGFTHTPPETPTEPPSILEDIPLPQEAPPEDAFAPPPDDSFAPPPEEEYAPVELPEPSVPQEEQPVFSGGASASAPEDAGAYIARARQEKLKKALSARPAPGKKAIRKAAAPIENPTMLFGRGIRGRSIPMSDLSLDLGTVCVTGRILQNTSRELKKRNAWIISFDITDYTNSVTVSKFMEKKQAEPLLERLKTGSWVTVEGRLSLSQYSGDMELAPFAIAPASAPEPRMDCAEEKRAELHLHTRFSTNDGLSDVKDLVKRAIQWGHKAIAITDHGTAHGFPDAHNAAGGKIKVIYGVEAYYINDVDEDVVVRGGSGAALTDEIVCFDLETTGLECYKEGITEIGAVKIKNGEITGEYNTFVNPNRPISSIVTQLTGITDEMVADAPYEEEAVSDFLDWVGDCPMAAHNALFDMGFLSVVCQRMGRTLQNTSIDTMVLSQKLLPEQEGHKLNMVAEALHLPDFRHHRACDDGRMVAYILLAFRDKLQALGANRLSQLNEVLRPLKRGGKQRKPKPRHLIILAKNQSGLRNLYKLISLSLSLIHI